MTRFTRRQVVLGGLGLAGTGLLGGCSPASAPGPAHGTRTSFPAQPALSPAPGRTVVEKTLTAGRATVDLGGPRVETWAYDQLIPGPELRATAGDLLRITVDNQLPADTTIHWHGIALHNAADGVPGMTQAPITPGSRYEYEFLVPDPGTYFFHPHVGAQLDRGLYAPLIVDDPAEPGGYDAEWVVVLDDWVDGTGRTPDDVFAALTAGNGSDSGGMGGMDHSGMGDPPFGNAGDVTYPHFLINGRVPATPETFQAKPGQRVRLRVINAASDTIFTVALGGHRLTVTHSDGFGVEPVETDAFYIGMGERYDVIVALGDGVFPLVAVPFGKDGQALALLRSGSGPAPGASVRPSEVDGQILQASDLRPAQSARLPQRQPDASVQVQLSGQMSPYVWAINGAPFGRNTPLEVSAGQRLQLRVSNRTMMTHPVHVHGHTFALASGVRKDTVLVRPMEAITLELQADNPGEWMIHCHNIYHAEAGMMIALGYRG
ncbi:MAG: multicopper oxidase family protein [Micropruina sp.]|nr:multicopper oxidase family protein [Micropruina sp.]